MTGPLEGVEVVELAMALAEPSCGAILGEWGASVTKVEPLTGDSQCGNVSHSYFSQDNRQKRSVAVELRTDQGREIMLALLDRADVVVTNIRPARLDRLGLNAPSVGRLPIEANG